MGTGSALALAGPAVLMLLALFWGLGRMAFLYRRDGVRVLRPGWRQCTNVERALFGLAVVLDLYLLARPFRPDIDGFLGVLPSPFPEAGLAVMAIGLLAMAWCQLAMGRAWRIGLPPESEPGEALVTSGPYGWSRNPIYVAILVVLAGLVLAVPGPPSLVALVLTCLGLRQVVIGEERFLRRRHGAAFEAYAARVRRWL